MRASFVDLRKKSGEVVRALKRNESVTVWYRGKPAAIMQPLPSKAGGNVRAQDHPAFGLWKDRADLAAPAAYVRRLRRGRHHGL